MAEIAAGPLPIGVEPLEGRALLAVGPIPVAPIAAGHWTFDRGTGTTAADTGTGARTATLGSGATWTTGGVGASAIHLNGTAAAVATATGPAVNTAGSFTASAWVRLDSISGYQTALSIAGTNVAGFFLGLRADTGTFAFSRLGSDATGTASVAAAPAAPLAGRWYHLVGVDDVASGKLSLYVDGKLAGTAAYAGGWAATGNTLIGHGFYGGQQVDYVTGSVDDAQLFGSALSAAQVAALDQPAAYSFDDGTGTTAADVSGHGKTLALGAGASWTGGRLGSNALALNGTSTAFASNPTPAVDTAQNFAISAWVNLAGTGGFQTIASIDGASKSGFYLQLRGDTGKFAFTRLGSDAAAAIATHADAAAAPVAGTWYNLVGVNDVTSGRLLLYVNGVLQSSVAYTGGWQATGATVIGAGKFNGARVDALNGKVDDVRFYNSALSVDAAASIGTAGGSILDIDTTRTGITVSPDLFGAFMEDINYGGEGGIYNDEVRNGGFNDATNPLNAWSAVTGAGVAATLTSDATTGPTAALTRSGKLTISSGASSSARAGIANSGFFGVAVAPSTTYAVEFYAKATPGFTGPLTVTVESTTGTVHATATVASITGTWAKYKVNLVTGSTAPVTATNRFVLSTKSAAANGATIWFGAVHLFPPAYANAANHLRIDLMQKLAAMKPAVFRVPGGNYLEGNVYADRFQWSETIGRVEDRPGHMNSAWGYWSSDGMGLDEYLQMAEEIGAKPVLAVYAGYNLGGSSDTGTTLANDVTDAINELHYVLDPVTTAWGARRAANGHAAPYKVGSVEVGNEDFFSATYSTRYPLFYNAIRAAFPSLKIIASHTDTGGKPYDVLDEHFYNSPKWFAANSHYFDNVPRGASKVFVGEWAANEGWPTNDMNSAIGDAAWLLGLERNSDLVTMESYAPIWANVNGVQWVPDLIGFDNTTSYGSPSYYAQVMLANHHGTQVVHGSIHGASGLQTLVTKTGTTYYVTVINTTGSAEPVTINLSGVKAVGSSASMIRLSAASGTSTNSIASPTAVVPITSTLSGVAPQFAQTFPANSISIITITAGGAPTVATAATVTPSTVTGKTATVSALGADDGGEAALTYSWSAAGPAAVAFSANGTNAAKSDVATFAKAGSYVLTCTIRDKDGLATTTKVNVNVVQTITSLRVTAPSATLYDGQTMAISAVLRDQFGNAMATQPTFAWSLARNDAGGSLSSTGVYTAPARGGGLVTVRAATAGNSATASFTVIDPSATTLAAATLAATAEPQAARVSTYALTFADSLVVGASELDEFAFVP